jgi:hypothetical protein
MSPDNSNDQKTRDALTVKMWPPEISGQGLLGVIGVLVLIVLLLLILKPDIRSIVSAMQVHHEKLVAED